MVRGMALGKEWGPKPRGTANSLASLLWTLELGLDDCVKGREMKRELWTELTSKMTAGCRQLIHMELARP